MLDASLQAVDRGAKLVRQLMVFSRREALQPHPVDPRALIAGVGELLQKAVGAPVAIETAIAPDVAAAMIDATQAELAVLNLAINARDAMPQGGTLTIGARNARLAGSRGAPRGRRLRGASVGDTGTGMPPRCWPASWSPSSPPRRSARAPGSGCPWCMASSPSSGGDMRIESRPGVGTTVSLWLPRAEAAAEPEGASDSAGAGGRRWRGLQPAAGG